MKAETTMKAGAAMQTAATMRAFTGLRAASAKRKDLGYISELAEAGALTAVIDTAYPLRRIADAYRHVDAGHKQGNVVVTMTELAGGSDPRTSRWPNGPGDFVTGPWPC